MSKLINIITGNHLSIKRDYLSRMSKKKPLYMKESKKFGINYWDGKRYYGYGGYRYIEGKLEPIANKLIRKFKLNEKSKILEIGCGKGYLLYEIKRKLPKINIIGHDISTYALKNSKKEVRKYLFKHSAQEKTNFKKKFFDLVFSINTLHNLKNFNLDKSIQEINRIGKKQFIAVESYKNEKELFNLQCWSLTCQAFYSKNEWEYIFKKNNYKGNYEFIFFK